MSHAPKNHLKKEVFFSVVKGSTEIGLGAYHMQIPCISFMTSVIDQCQQHSACRAEVCRSCLEDVIRVST